MASSWPRMWAFDSPDDVNTPIPDGWRVDQIENLYHQLPIGKRFDQRSSASHGVVQVIDQSPGGVIGWHDEVPGVIATRELPVVTFANHTCEMRLMREPFSVIQNVFPLVGRIGVCDSEFLYYGTKGRVHLEEYKGHFPDYRRKWILVPPLPEQRAIAHILGTLDDKIELNCRMNETLEAIARALFRSWFVDFDPVRAKSEGRDPGLPPHPADLFPNSFEDSELGEIPKGWTPTYVGEIAELQIGGDWGADAPTSKQSVAVRCLRGLDVHNLRVAGQSEAPLRFVTEESVGKRVPIPGDVIVEGSGECGRSLAFSPAVARVFDEPVVYSNFCKRLRAASPAHAVFLERLLNELVSSGEMKNYVTGTAMPNLDLKGLLVGFQDVLPPQPILIEFAQYSDLVRARLLAPESRTLAALRDTLLPKLISGELRVADAERVVEDAL